MKILSVNQIQKADAYTIKHEPIADIDLMERAASKINDWFINEIPLKRKIKIFCGMGNNGGDGLALARMLSLSNYTVSVFLVQYSNTMSSSCKINYERIKKNEKIDIHFLNDDSFDFLLKKKDVIVDAIFGSGLTRPVKGFTGRIIEKINNSGSYCVAVDVPSGFFVDKSNESNDGKIIHADFTLSLQFPKLGFLFPENDRFVGDWNVLPIGLHPKFINEVDVKNYFLEKKDIKPLLRKRNRFSHKGTFGHGLLIAGGYGKMGAAVLAAKAASRSGAGLVTAHIPKSGYEIMQITSPETMCSIDDKDRYFSSCPKLEDYNAIAVGPGLGTFKETHQALKQLIQTAKTPVIFDADAINILSENKTWLSFLPKECIFTPHPKEFERLIGKSSNSFDRLRLQKEFSIKYHAFVLLKGGFSCLTTPMGNVYFNSTGNPGMATGGSGDVLTGIILGLKARGFSSLHSAIFGMYLHGLAGDYAAQKKGQETMIASDIVQKLGKALKKIN